MTAEGRHERELWEGPVSHPAPVLGVIYAELELDARDLEQGLAESRARADDAYWAGVVRRGWRGWQAFTNWWVARRWLKPRDVTKE